MLAILCLHLILCPTPPSGNNQQEHGKPCNNQHHRHSTLSLAHGLPGDSWHIMFSYNTINNNYITGTMWPVSLDQYGI